VAVARDRLKHDKVLEVAAQLPAARRAVAQDLELEGMPYERALGTAFRLLDLGFFRIGGEAYAEANNSFGLATIHKEHVSIESGSVIFNYVAKSGQEGTSRSLMILFYEPSATYWRDVVAGQNSSHTRMDGIGGMSAPMTSTAISRRTLVMRCRPRTSAPGTGL
jgi:DNA topoisomerase IB